jgi:hypothetical protein
MVKKRMMLKNHLVGEAVRKQATDETLRDDDIVVIRVGRGSAQFGSYAARALLPGHWWDSDPTDSYSDYDVGEGMDPLHHGGPLPINTEPPW